MLKTVTYQKLIFRHTSKGECYMENSYHSGSSRFIIHHKIGDGHNRLPPTPEMLDVF
jgi:hypothetical protein